MMSLVAARKRKDIHNPRVTSHDKGKVRIIEHSADATADTLTRFPRLRSNIQSSRALSNIRRGSFKIFSVFRSKGLFTEMESQSSTSNATQRPSTAPKPAIDVKASLQSQSVPDIAIPPLDFSSDRHGSSLLQLTNAAVFDGESEPTLDSARHRTMTLHVSKSTPGLSKQLTTKLSETLLHNSTVIHRPKPSSRPTVLKLDPSNSKVDSPDASVAHGPAAEEDPITPPSQSPSTPGRSTGPLSFQSKSTAPTSIVSSGNAPRSASTTHIRGDKAVLHVSSEASPPNRLASETIGDQWLVFPRQDAPRLTRPSISTVENAAAAKIYFESYFNTILETRITARSMRRRTLEHKLFAMAISNEDRHVKRQE
ncbi:hypothetical protein BCR34DRAFT_464844, partial [Clohesyomyces aquaticus]